MPWVVIARLENGFSCFIPCVDGRRPLDRKISCNWTSDPGCWRFVFFRHCWIPGRCPLFTYFVFIFLMTCSRSAQYFPQNVILVPLLDRPRFVASCWTDPYHRLCLTLWWLSFLCRELPQWSAFYGWSQVRITSHHLVFPRAIQRRRWARCLENCCACWRRFPVSI